MALSNDMSPVQRLFGLLKVNQQEITSIYIYAIFNGLINLSLPLGIQAIINLISGGQMSLSWALLVTFVILGILFTGILQVMQLHISENIQQRIFTFSAFEFAHRLPRMRYQETDHYYMPEIVNRFFDTLNIQKGLPKIVIDFSTASLQIIFGLILLSFYHPFFIVFSFLLILVVFLILRLTGPRGLQTSLQESKYKYQVVHWLEELGRTMATFKLAGDTRLPMQKTDVLVTGYLKARKAHFKVLIFQFINLVGFKVMVTTGFLILGGSLVIEQRMNVGQFVAAEIIILLIFSSVEKLITSLETIYDVLTGLEKLGFVSDFPLEKSEGLSYVNKEGHPGMEVNIKDLSFRFDNQSKDVLKNINLHIRPGEKICLSGTSGSGKSVLIRMLGAVYDDYSGSISYDRLPMGNYNIEHLRSHIGDLMSNELIFQGTLEENITAGRRWITFEEVKKTADIVGLTSFVEQLPEGYRTLLDPHGRRLPRSIATKILIARCFAGRPSLVLIDDLLNIFDGEDRLHIEELIFNPPCPCTIVMTTRDKNLLPRFNRLVILQEGEIAFDGKVDAGEKLTVFKKIFRD